MKRLTNSKPVKLAILVVIVMMGLGLVKLAMSVGKDQPEAGIPPEQAAADATQAFQLGKTSNDEEVKQQGFQAGIATAVAPADIPQQAIARNASLDKASELAMGDMENLICARAAAYLEAADKAKWEQGKDPERWLAEQLRNENQAAFQVTGGSSVDGSAIAVENLDSPLINRAAILMAYSQITTGQVRACRVSVVSSGDAIAGFLLAAQRLMDSRPFLNSQPVADEPTAPLPMAPVEEPAQ